MIDVIFIILIVFFGIKGYKKGLLYTLIRFLIAIIAVVVATHFSGWIICKLYQPQSENVQTFLPTIGFIFTLSIVALILILLYKILIKPIEKATLPILNRLLGALFYMAFIILLFGSVIWFFHSINLISDETLKSSLVSKYLLPIVPLVFDVFGAVIPVMKKNFQELNEYFEHLSKQLPQ